MPFQLIERTSFIPDQPHAEVKSLPATKAARLHMQIEFKFKGVPAAIRLRIY